MICYGEASLYHIYCVDWQVVEASENEDDATALPRVSSHDQPDSKSPKLVDPSLPNDCVHVKPVKQSTVKQEAQDEVEVTKDEY